MKPEVSFFKDRRLSPTAANIIKAFRALGWTDVQIKEHFLQLKKIKEEQEAKHIITKIDSAVAVEK